MSTLIGAGDWAQYEQDGYLRLGSVLSEAELGALQNRIDAIMMGTADVDYGRMLMQRDSDTGAYGDLPAQTKGFQGPTLDYRKIQDLEFDAQFRSFMELPIFREICDHVYGTDTPIAAYRAMFMNKPARKGTLLPWHQDRWTSLDRDPMITVWTALDPATIDNGCVQIIPGSHHEGIINPKHGSGFLTEAQAVEFAQDERSEFLELAPGEAVLLHNWLLHRSDVNHTDISRRAFSVCYMDGRTRCASGATFTPLFNPL